MPVAASNSTALRQLRFVYAAFFGAGFTYAGWAVRIPDLKQAMGRGAGELGLMLLCVALGSMLAIGAAGVLIRAIGAGNGIAFGGGLAFAGLVGVGAAHAHAPMLVTGVAMFVTGCGSGLWDVSMNVVGAQVEQRVGVIAMPRMHAAFSVGTVTGGLIGVVMVRSGVGVAANLVLVCVVSFMLVAAAVRALPSARVTQTDAGGAQRDAPASSGLVRDAWRDPATIVLGLFVMCAAFAEGAGIDWIAVSIVESLV